MVICFFICLCPAHVSPALFAYLLFSYFDMFICFFGFARIIELKWNILSKEEETPLYSLLVESFAVNAYVDERRDNAPLL